MTTSEVTGPVWACIIERDIDRGCEIELFWHESDAVEAARSYLADRWPREQLNAPADVREAIEAANQIVGKDEYLTLDRLSIASGSGSDGIV